MLRKQPTEIRMSAEEYLTPSQRAEKINTSFICSTRWTKLMLLRMQQLDRSGLNEGEIFMHLRAEFNAPATVEELQQERAFSKMGEGAHLFVMPSR